MAGRESTPFLAPVATAARRRAHRFISSTLGQGVLAVCGLKLFVTLWTGAPQWLQILDTAGTVLLVFALGYVLVRILALVQRRFLWRVRRKLVLSYLLIGLVPILLFGAFFLVSGVLLLSTVSSALVHLSFEDVMDEASGLASTTVVDLQNEVEMGQMRPVLARRLRGMSGRFPHASMAVMPLVDGNRIVAGSWDHMTDHPELPMWIETDTGGYVLVRSATGWSVVARSVRLFETDGQRYMLVADLPITGGVVRRMQTARGVTLTTVTVAEVSSPMSGVDAIDGSAEVERVTVGGVPVAPTLTLELPSVAFVDFVDWSTGDRVRGSIGFRVHPTVFSRRLTQAGDVSLATVFLLGLVAIGVMFLTIEAVALVMGFALARSITGAVHELFTGTERVRQGDLVHPIRVETQDQLGELAESFNAMTASIADLLTQAEEKRRLEEELRIARDIQMSLLPPGSASLPGLAVTAACRPAREVGGDYYDFLPLGDHRLGILIADVSGKGASAAFYMAELKGLMLALSRFHDSPKQLLMEVNRILSANLDTRTFITMTYVVVDVEARMLTYARAGHTPLIHVSPTRAPDILIPGGLVVGLQLEGAEEKFAELLEECTLPVGPGDLFALFTDGITEAMNEEADLFGEERLGQLLADHIHLSFEQLRERVLGDVEGFVGGAEQHDDMTLVLLRIDEPAQVSI